jgi:hypothetical protein
MTIHWGIAENVTNKIIGTCGYYRGFDKGGGELGFVLSAQYRGKGFMTSSISSVFCVKATNKHHSEKHSFQFIVPKWLHQIFA